MTTVPRRHRFTIEEYERFAERSLARGARVELIDGAIFDMTPQGPWHVQCTRFLSETLIRGARGGEWIYVQSTLRLSRWSAPEPDIVVARPGQGRWELPSAEDVLLIIEVADTTLSYDLGTKVPQYQKEGVPEVWVVDLQGRQVHVFRRSAPGGGSETSTRVRPPAQLVACGVSIEVGSLFP